MRYVLNIKLLTPIAIGGGASSITLASNEPRISAKELGSPERAHRVKWHLQRWALGFSGLGWAEEPCHFHSAGYRNHFCQSSMGFHWVENTEFSMSKSTFVVDEFLLFDLMVGQICGWRSPHHPPTPAGPAGPAGPLGRSS